MEELDARHLRWGSSTMALWEEEFTVLGSLHILFGNGGLADRVALSSGLIYQNQ